MIAIVFYVPDRHSLLWSFPRKREATFARFLREKELTEEEHSGVVAALDHRWPTYERPALTENLIRLAGDFAQRYALRGYDSIQLASAFVCHGQRRDLRFLYFDDDLNEAAKQIESVYEAPVQSSIWQAEAHVWEEVGARLDAMAREKKWREMPSLICDEMLAAFTVEAAGPM